MFLHTIISDPSSKAYLEGSIDEHRNKILKLLGEYKVMGVAKGQENLYAELLANLDRYWAIHDRVEEISRVGERDAALSIIRMEGNKSFSDSVNSLKKLLKEERDTAYKAYKESDFFAKLIIIVTFAFTLLAIIVAGGLWLTLTRSLVKPILTI